MEKEAKSVKTSPTERLNGCTEAFRLNGEKRRTGGEVGRSWMGQGTGRLAVAKNRGGQARDEGARRREAVSRGWIKRQRFQRWGSATPQGFVSITA